MEVIPSSQCCLNIGVDIDDTLCDFGGEFINYYNKLHDTYYVFGDMEVCDYALFLDELTEYTHDLLMKFSDEYIDKLIPFDGSFDILSGLKKQFNCNLYIVTHRSEIYKRQTTDWISKNYPGIFNGIEFGNNYDINYRQRSKYEMCSSLNINILIDDRLDILSGCKTGPNEFLCILFERPWSIVSNHSQLISFKNWRNFSIRNILNEFINKKLIFYNKDIIIGISGKLGSGKDTSCDILIQQFPYLSRYAFADRLKEVVSTLTRINRDYLNDQEGKRIIPIGFDKSCGQLLQIIGEGLCDKISPDLWVNCLLQDTKRDHAIVITDTRKIIEANAIKKKCGLLIRINGDPADIRKLNKSNRDLNHSTEIELDDYQFDYIIENNGTIDDLKNKLNFIIYPYLFNELIIK